MQRFQFSRLTILISSSKSLLFLCLFVCLLSNHAQAQEVKLKSYQETPKNYYTVESFLSKLKKDDLVKELREFIRASRPSRMVNSKGHTKALSYLQKRVHEIDPKANERLSVHSFDPDLKGAINEYQNDFEQKIAKHYKPQDEEYKKWKRFTESVVKTLKSLKGVKGKNLIWEKKGEESPEDVLIVGAHYDTISFNPKTHEIQSSVTMEGADDNASGVASLLGMIHFLKSLKLKKTVRIIFFDFQELGQLGSQAYVKDHKKQLKEQVKAYINVEKIGHDTKIFDEAEKLGNYKAYTRPKSQSGYKKDLKIAKYFSEMADNTSARIEFDISSEAPQGSDQERFWQAGIGAVNFTGNDETDSNRERHHTPKDFTETLNFKSFYEATQGLTGAVIGWAFDLSEKG